MKITINIKDETVWTTINALYANGCTDLAESIENACIKEWKNKNDKAEIRNFIDGIAENGKCRHAVYFKNSKGEIMDALYEIWGRDEDGKLITYVTRKPFITSLGTVYGRPESRKWIEYFYNEALKHGAKEV